MFCFFLFVDVHFSLPWFLCPFHCLAPESREDIRLTWQPESPLESLSVSSDSIYDLGKRGTLNSRVVELFTFVCLPQRKHCPPFFVEEHVRLCREYTNFELESKEHWIGTRLEVALEGLFSLQDSLKTRTLRLGHSKTLTSAYLYRLQ
jgi:hypothetical protein